MADRLQHENRSGVDYPMTQSIVHDFGTVDEKGDAFEFHYHTGKLAQCRMESMVQTERGPSRTEMAAIPTSMWRKVSVRVVRELISGMGEEERTRKKPTLKTGTNRLGPLLGRELAVLLWALMENDANERLETLLHGWRELAREERWWLFAKGSAPGQGLGIGWRRALFHALSEPGDSRSATMDSAQKKSPQISPLPRSGGQPRSGKTGSRKGKPEKKGQPGKSTNPKKKTMTEKIRKVKTRKATTKSRNS